MPRYIDAEQKITVTYYDEEHEEWSKKTKTIYEFLDENADEEIPTADVVDKEWYDQLLKSAIIISDELKSYQNVDVVKVVRCKDCKHLVRNEGVCKVLSNNYEPPVYVYDDDFCSRGERMEDEDE